MKKFKRLKNILLLTALLPFIAGGADAALVWQKVQSAGGSGGGDGGTACYFRMVNGTYARVVPVTTTIQYIMIGGGAGQGFARGVGGDTKIVVNSVVTATAAGGTASGQSGTKVQGTLTVNAGDLLEIYLGGGGGGGANSDNGRNGRTYPNPADTSRNGRGGGGGDYGGGGGGTGGGGGGSTTGGTGGAVGQDGNNGSSGSNGGTGSTNGAFGEGGVSGSGGNGGGIDMTYAAAGCWVN